MQLDKARKIFIISYLFFKKKIIFILISIIDKIIISILKNILKSKLKNKCKK